MSITDFVLIILTVGSNSIIIVLHQASIIARLRRIADQLENRR